MIVEGELARGSRLWGVNQQVASGRGAHLLLSA